MINAKPTRRRLFTLPPPYKTTRISYNSHQPPRNLPINHGDPLRERPTDDAEPLRRSFEDSQLCPSLHVTTTKTSNFRFYRSPNPTIIHLCNRMVREILGGEWWRIWQQSFHARPRNELGYLSTARLYAKSLAYAYKHWHKPVLWDRSTFLSSLTIRWQKTHNITNSYTDPQGPNRRLHQNLSKHSQTFCGLKIIRGSEIIKCVFVCT